MRPEYIVTEEGLVVEEDDDTGELRVQRLFSAEVILPSLVDASLRRTKSKLLWKSERNATKDAAFEAYVALYKKGLVNDNLLPITFDRSPNDLEKIDSVLEVQEQFNPWATIAKAWKNNVQQRQRDLTVKDQAGAFECTVQILIPCDIPDDRPISLYWDSSSEWKLEFGQAMQIPPWTQIIDHTTALLSLAYGHRWNIIERRHLAQFTVEDIDVLDLHLKRTVFAREMNDGHSTGLLRNLRNWNRPYIFHSWLPTKPSLEVMTRLQAEYEEFDENQPFVVAKPWPRRSNFLHPLSAALDLVKNRHERIFPQSFFDMDLVPAKYAQFGLFIPSLFHELEIRFLVAELCKTTFNDIGISDRELIRTAISAPVAQERTNYQKLEFLGDSILKLLVSAFLSSKYPYWPEGYLSNKKDAIVSNSRLCKAVIACGVDKFIHTRAFVAQKWTLPSIDDFTEDYTEATRELSSKTIADVAEALIGAGWRMGGSVTALKIIRHFLPEVDLPSLEIGRQRLFELAPKDVSLPRYFQHLEELAGYSFRRKSLLIQAMTHGSDVNAYASYERIEFLGDAILECIVVSHLFQHEDKLSHSQMHLYKTAVVNHDYLSFIALEWSISRKRTDIRMDPINDHIEQTESEVSLPLWRFMKHGLPEVGEQQRTVEQRYAAVRSDILQSLETGTDYPWSLLARIHASKFYSDIVESLIAAVWIDSGSFDTCKQMLYRMGLLTFLDRIIKNRIHVLHPREELAILAAGKEVRYEVQQTLGDKKIDWTCSIFVEDVMMSEVTDGVSNEEVRTRAAEMAVSVLKGQNVKSS